MAAVSFRDILSGYSEVPDSDTLLASFLDWAALKGLTLYPAQEAAMLELMEGKNVILNTPTGSGKSLVASVLHFQSLARRRRSVYTCPIKALVNEKWMALCREFGPENVGLSTGDATVNRDAPILCCTAEILANIALSEGPDCGIADVVMDEFHYYSDRDRGVAWQIPLLELSKTRFLLMSATLGDTAFFEAEMTRRNGLPSVTVRSQDRPVPLHFSYSEAALSETVQRLVNEGKAPVYVVHFTQADAAANAQSFTSLDLCTKEEKASVAEALQGFRFASPYGPDIKRWLRQGIGLHHAGLLPKYRILVEKLAQQGLLKVICGTDTLGVGVNVPIRTVLFTQLCKYSGDKTAILTARDFHQIAGRAGRKGFDSQGFVVAQAPEHVIENIKLAAKAAQSGRKYQKRQPPERGYVPWDASTFQRLIAALPEKLVSRFQVGHGMLLNVLSRRPAGGAVAACDREPGAGRAGDGCRAMRDLIDRCHDSEKDKAAHRKRAFQLFRPLVERGIVEITPPALRGPDRPRLRVNVDLQRNFAMDQALSLYLLDTIPRLDAESPDHALDLLTLVESILEDPDLILRKQLDMLKTEKVAELKAQGVDYDQRMLELEAMEYPKPLREFIYATFNDFAAAHPWVGDLNIRPKSIAREMLEGFHTFSTYVKRYGLDRTEGLLLRHLNSVFKVLANTVPDAAKTDAVREMEQYFRDLVRRVDSSLLEEWERLQDPDWRPPETSEPLPPGAEDAARTARLDITADPEAFLTAIRTRIFAFLAALARQDFPGAAEILAEGREGLPEWTEEALRERLRAYRDSQGPIRLDPAGRARDLTSVDGKSEPGVWTVRQTLLAAEEAEPWSAVFTVDLAVSRAAGLPVLRLIAFEPVDGSGD